jgi:hypothetical protein
VINSFGDTAAGRSFFAASLAKTLGSVFASVRAHPNEKGNLFFAASARPALELRPVDTSGTHPDVAADVNACLGLPVTIDTTAGMVLTDDYNPVDFFDAPNRERHRRDLAMSLRGL